MVKCPKCGENISKETLTCQSCNAQYSEEEYKELKTKEEISSWLFENPKVEEYSTNDNDAIQQWLLGEEFSATKLVKELEDGIKTLTKSEIDTIQTTIVWRIKEISVREQEVKKNEEKANELLKNLEQLLKNYSSQKPDIDLVFKENIELMKEINELKHSQSEMQKNLKFYESTLRNIVKLLGASDLDLAGILDQIPVKLKNLVFENERLVIETEKKDAEITTFKELAKEWANSTPQNIQKVRSKELELKELELALEAQSKEIAFKTERLKDLESMYTRSSSTEDSLKIRRLEEEVERLTSELNSKNQSTTKPGKEIETGYAYQKLMEENKKYKLEIDDLKSAVVVKDQDLQKLNETLRFKENEMNRREEDLSYREKKLSEQLRKFEAEKLELEEFNDLKKQHHLEDLQDAIRKKEEELQTKTKFLETKEKELALKEKGMIEKEIDSLKEEVLLEVKEEKVKTGTRRLNDLLYGGFPIGSNIIVYGPAYSGKEVLIYSFLFEGLKKGVPSIIVLLDKTMEELSEEMNFVIHLFSEYLDKQLIYVIDAYSRSIGDTQNVKGVKYVNNQTDVETIIKYVDELASEIKKSHSYYRLAFFSLSGLLTFMDNQRLLKFLQPFTTKRKRDKAVSLYLIEKGIHSENDVQMISYLMEGIIDFKIENLKTFLQVRGITDVQSRAWIEITPSKSGLIMGSFSLGHIR